MHCSLPHMDPLTQAEPVAQRSQQMPALQEWGGCCETEISSRSCKPSSSSLLPYSSSNSLQIVLGLQTVP